MIGRFVTGRNRFGSLMAEIKLLVVSSGAALISSQIPVVVEQIVVNHENIIPLDIELQMLLVHLRAWHRCAQGQSNFEKLLPHRCWHHVVTYDRLYYVWYVEEVCLHGTKKMWKSRLIDSCLWKLTNEKREGQKDAHISSCSYQSTGYWAAYLLNVTVRSELARGKGLNLLNAAVRSQLARRPQTAYAVRKRVGRRHESMYTDVIAKTERDEWVCWCGMKWTGGFAASIKSNKKQ